MAHHSMALAHTANHAALPNDSHIDHHVDHHKSNQHAGAHDCCDDSDGVCSTSSACATHCAASFAQRALTLCPVMTLSGLEADTVFNGPLPLNVDGPFKPPR